MANTFFRLHFHVVFSTKNRQRFLQAGTKARVWAYLGGIAKKNDTKPVVIGGTDDHVHMLLEIPPKHSPSKIVQTIKGGASKWVHDNFPKLHAFRWQDGYGIFTVSKSNVAKVIHYIEHQEDHHRNRTFEEEFRSLLEHHGIEFDERYLLG